MNNVLAKSLAVKGAQESCQHKVKLHALHTICKSSLSFTTSCIDCRKVPFITFLIVSLKHQSIKPTYNFLCKGTLSKGLTIKFPT